VSLSDDWSSRDIWFIENVFASMKTVEGVGLNDKNEKSTL